MEKPSTGNKSAVFPRALRPVVRVSIPTRVYQAPPSRSPPLAFQLNLVNGPRAARKCPTLRGHVSRLGADAPGGAMWGGRQRRRAPLGALTLALRRTRAAAGPPARPRGRETPTPTTEGARPRSAPLLTSTASAPPPSRPQNREPPGRPTAPPRPAPSPGCRCWKARCPRRGEATSGPPGKRVRKGQGRRPTSSTVDVRGWRDQAQRNWSPRYLRKPGAGDRPSGAHSRRRPGLRRLLAGRSAAAGPSRTRACPEQGRRGPISAQRPPWGRGRLEGARAAPPAPAHG